MAVTALRAGVTLVLVLLDAEAWSLLVASSLEVAEARVEDAADEVLQALAGQDSGELEQEASSEKADKGVLAHEPEQSADRMEVGMEDDPLDDDDDDEVQDGAPPEDAAASATCGEDMSRKCCDRSGEKPRSISGEGVGIGATVTRRVLELRFLLRLERHKSTPSSSPPSRASSCSSLLLPLFAALAVALSLRGSGEGAAEAYADA